MSLFGWLSDRLAKPGSGGVRYAAQQQQGATEQQRKWTEEDRARALGWRGMLEEQVTGTYAPMMKGLSEVMFGNAPATGQYSWMNVNKNPFDTGKIGQQVYGEQMATSNQTLADQYAAAVAGGTSSLLRRGLGPTSFPSGLRSSLSIQRGQQGARNMAAAGAAGREATFGSFNIDEQLRKEALNNWLMGKTTLQEYMQFLASLGDTSGSAAAMGNVASGWGNVGQGYQNLGNMSYLPGAMQLAAYGLTGGFGGGEGAAAPGTLAPQTLSSANQVKKNPFAYNWGS